MLKHLLILAPLLAGVAVVPALAQQQPSSASAAYQIGGPFSLTDQHGRLFTDADVKGRPYLVFFGFTHCPEICPTTLFELTNALGELAQDADRLVPIFVTVDPERDTQEHLANYLELFDARIVGLHGSEAQTAAIARQFRATYRKVPTGDGDYTMDHTAIIYLMGPDGRLFDKIEYGEAYASQLEKLRRLLAAGS